MSVKCDEESTGNSEQDWEIFDVLCKDVSVNAEFLLKLNFDSICYCR